MQQRISSIDPALTLLMCDQVVIHERDNATVVVHHPEHVECRASSQFSLSAQVMPIVRRIYLSLPVDPWLPDNLKRLKWSIVEEIEKLGYATGICTNPRGKPGLASAKSWHSL